MTTEDQIALVLRIHNFSRLLGAVIVPGSLWLIMSAIAPAAGVMWWVFFLLLSAVGYFLFSATAMVLAVFYVASSNPSTSKTLEEKVDDVPIPSTHKASAVVITIVATSKSFGTFGNMPMFDWMDVQLAGSDVVRRCTYVSTVSGEIEQAALPSTCIVVPPGIVYQLAD